MNSTFRVVVVDDEKPARGRLATLVERDARVELVASCAGGAEALDTIADADTSGRPVQILFLDVQMPELDGFGVVSALVRRRGAENVPVVIFVTAHDEYALRAFDAHAVDYLLKPFSDERFQAALDRAIGHVRAGLAHTLMSQMQALLGASLAGASPDDTKSTGPRHRPALDRIAVKGPHRVRDGMYVKLHTRDGGVHLHRGLLGSLDAELDHRRFVRVHRSAIINLDMVDELRHDAHGDYVAVLRDRTEVRVGRRFRSRLQARLGQPL